MSAASWSASVAAVLKAEGGYANDPKDPGGETNFGISKRAYPNLDIKALTVADAEAIYRRDYWDKLRCDDLPTGVDYALFDFGANSGVARAAVYLQSVVHMNQDGVIGPLTIAACQKASATSVVTLLCNNRLIFLEKQADWPTYGKGWAARVAAVKTLALQMVAGAPKAAPVSPAPQPTLVQQIEIGAIETAFPQLKEIPMFPTIVQMVIGWLPGIPDDITLVEAEVKELMSTDTGPQKAAAALVFAQNLVNVLRKAAGKAPVVFPD